MQGIITYIKSLTNDQLRALFHEVDNIRCYYNDQVNQIDLSDELNQLIEQEKSHLNNNEKAAFSFVYNCICDTIISRFKEGKL